ncbi:MAG: aspartate/glutamate racemase family protein [Pseudomonadota bacterium]
MAQIGLIGGIGPAATDYYYRRLISAFASREQPLELTMVHADTPTLLGNLEAGAADAQVAIYNKLADRLVRAGADCVVVTSIAGHFCIERFKESAPLPVIDIISSVNEAVSDLGLKKLGLIGTRTVMESGFYGGITSAKVTAPTGQSLADVHTAYVSMAAVGAVNEHQRQVFDRVCAGMLNRDRVDAIVLGGTDLALVYPEGSAPFPVVDCAAIHVDAIVEFAVGQ